MSQCISVCQSGKAFELADAYFQNKRKERRKEIINKTNLIFKARNKNTKEILNLGLLSEKSKKDIRFDDKDMED